MADLIGDIEEQTVRPDPDLPLASEFRVSSLYGLQAGDPNVFCIVGPHRVPHDR
jgi:hypothetical protein